MIVCFFDFSVDWHFDNVQSNCQMPDLPMFAVMTLGISENCDIYIYITAQKRMYDETNFSYYYFEFGVASWMRIIG